MLASCRNEINVLQYQSGDRFQYDDSIYALNKITLCRYNRFAGKFGNMQEIFGI